LKGQTTNRTEREKERRRDKKMQREWKEGMMMNWVSWGGHETERENSGLEGSVSMALRSSKTSENMY
jgi:hypothetical protein